MLGGDQNHRKMTDEENGKFSQQEKYSNALNQ